MQLYKIIPTSIKIWCFDLIQHFFFWKTVNGVIKHIKIILLQRSDVSVWTFKPSTLCLRKIIDGVIRVESDKATSFTNHLLQIPPRDGLTFIRQQKHYPGRPHGPSFLSPRKPNDDAQQITQCSCVGLLEPVGSLIRHNVFIIAYIPSNELQQKVGLLQISIPEESSRCPWSTLHVENCSKKEVRSTNSYLYNANNLSTLIT